MKDRILELKRKIYDRLPERWGLRSKVQQITHTLSEPYEFQIKNIKPDHAELNLIRQTILLHPYTVATRPVRTKILEMENGLFELSVSFVVINHEHGKQIQETIQKGYHPESGKD